MRKLLALIVIAALAWGGYWLWASRAVEGGITQWISDRQSEGWVADVEEVTTRGFPNRFDTTLTNVTLADPDTGLAWSAPFFQIFALSYRPNHIIAVWPHDQRLATPQGGVDVTADDMRASVTFDAGTALTLNKATFDLTAVEVESDGGALYTLDKGLLATRQAVATPFAHDVFFEATQLRPDDALRLVIDPTGRLPDVFDVAKVDMTLTFDRAWDRFALEVERPKPTALKLRLAEARWGELLIQMAGDLTYDTFGRASGEVTLKAENWRDILGLAVATGLIPTDLEVTIERLLAGLASASGRPDTIDVPITITGGQMRLGFIPLGPAPLFVIP